MIAIGGEADIGLTRAVRLLFPSPLARIVQAVERKPAGLVLKALREAGGQLSERDLKRKFAALGEGGLRAAILELLEDEIAEVADGAKPARGPAPVVLRLLRG